MTKIANFIILGAEKAGTTALYNNLSQHPQIYMAPKEPEFFSFEGTNSPLAKANTIKEYAKLFEGANNAPVLGDVSTTYLPCPEAPTRIKYYAPNAKMVAVLRHPAERAYSRFWMRLHKNPDLLPYTPEKFWDFFDNSGRGELLNIRNRGFYGEQLARYFKSFPREQFRVYLYEDYRANGHAVMEDILDFLGLDTSYVPQNIVHGASDMPRFRFIRKLNESKNWNPTVLKLMRFVLPQKSVRNLRCVVDRVNSGNKPSLDPETKNKLINYYREDILKLQDLLDWDLSSWLSDTGIVFAGNNR